MILVVGASGVLGGRIVRRLVDEQHPVRVLARSRESADALRATGADVVRGDLRLPDTLADAVRGVAAVVTTANSAARGAPDTLETVDRDGTVALIDAARHEGIEQFVYVSAWGVSADHPSAFMRAKAAAESHLRESGVPATILRPTLFMESWIGPFVVAPVRAGRPVVIVGAGERRHSYIAVDDVAAFCVAVIGNPPALDRVITVGGPEALSWLDVVERAAEVVGRVIPVRHVAPGATIPGLPETVAQLAATLDRADMIVDSEDLAADLGVDLTSVRAWLERRLTARA